MPASLSRETEGGVSARAAMCNNTSATLAGDTVTGRAARGTGSPRDVGPTDPRAVTRVTLAQAGDDVAGWRCFDGCSAQTRAPHRIAAKLRGIDDTALARALDRS